VPRLIGFAAIVICVALAAAVYAQAASITVITEPTQTVSAFAVTASDGNTLSLLVRDGKVVVPSDLPLPWTITSTKFEPSVYTRGDLDQHHSLMLRELGAVKGTLQPLPKPEERNWSLLLKRTDSDSVAEVGFVPSDDGGFRVRVPAGLYVASGFGERTATRIRSGIVVKPGETTDLGALSCEATVKVTIRVVDAKRGNPVAHANLKWEPPDKAFNADVAQVLFAERWSATTDNRGVATFPSIGPIPVPVRWRISARGYADDHTMTIALTDRRDVALPDAKLRPEASIVARVTLPREASGFKDAMVTLREIQDSRMLRFVTVARKTLKEGDTTFPVTTYGPKRLSIESAKGRTIFYRDFALNSEKTVIDLAPNASEVRGSVVRAGDGVSGATVILADPQDARVILAKVSTDKDGSYHFDTYQNGGELFLYAMEYRAQGGSTGSQSKTIHADGRRLYLVDFDLPNAGCNVKVVDASTGVPLRARIDKRMEFTAGGAEMGLSETDADGRLSLAGFPEGTVTLHISAKGHRARETTVRLEAKPAEAIVKLEPTGEIEGRVVDDSGAPVGGARITGGYRDEITFQAYFNAVSDADGRFRFESAPPFGTTFYIAAARHALGITTLLADHTNTIVLSPPGTSVVILRPDNAPPTKVDLVIAAPAGAEYIPLGVLDDLAEVNSMNPLQLHATAKDGTVVLPEFLPPGTYDLFTFSKDKAHQRIGSITVPMRQSAVLAYKTK
jgi:protocatechuate 3,4-dioxygenase beta subunit